ncbi:unnamed protein product [Dracunculus medinensis]|uniref:O-acyltransferase n=1 Tax=Dracunculus medinensis TaxID=318479 RepID=A0A0N4UN34_DRAME|nr:unnamed protein product [Dracunculus medinensis]
MIDDEEHSLISRRVIRSSNFRSKHFQCRQSLLTELFEKTDISILWNLFLAFFLLLHLLTIIVDYLSTGNPFDHLWLITWNFSYFPQTMFVWCLMAISILIPYYILKFWSDIPSKEINFLQQLPFFFIYFFYLILFFILSLNFIFKMRLKCACTFIITCENTRIAMKIHSFIRETFPLDITDEIQFPTVSQLYYYFFCPSFIYRDNYPQTAKRSWKTILIYFLQIIAIILFVNLIFIQMIIPNFAKIPCSTMNFAEFIQRIIISILPGFFCLLSLFYGLLHCWLNMFAEILYFGDRQFYSNWWFSKNMAEYYRNWNLVVHDWLYTYIYKDIAIVVGGKTGLIIAQIIVFFISALFHEYWFGVALRFFYPVMFVLYFVFGGIFFLISRFIRNLFVWNTIMWMNLLVGTGIFVALYSQEWYARQRCSPLFDNAFLDFIIPRHLWFSE